MKITLNGNTYPLIEIQAFREQFALGPDFGIAHFESKDFTGLARIDSSNGALNELRHTVYQAIPVTIALSDLMDFLSRLSHLFRVKLYEVNTSIQLKPVEIDFAAAGFEDVCQALGYALILAVTTRSKFDFATVYQTWLDGTTRVASTSYPYMIGSNTWQIQVLNTAYGRIGLRVQTDEAVYYVRDAVYGCPAEGFMATLLAGVATRIATSVQSTL
ncbi:MAG: hypothetical protein MUF87_19390 [Anaerolineae bacterium]|jgi:hypothetical protein|nr:hypothetical protein [Anaerolineae bacterium]